MNRSTDAVMRVAAALSLFLFAGAAPAALESKQPAPAAGVHQKAESPDPDAHVLIAEIALERGEIHTAAQEYTAAARLSPNPTLAERATKVAYDNNQEMLAVPCARRWLQLSPDSTEARRYLAASALRVYDLKTSTEQFSHLLKNGYENPSAGFSDLSETLSGEENSYGVLSVVKAVAASHVRVPEAQYAVAAAALRAYNYALAIDSARKALALDPKHEAAKRLLNRALVIGGKTQEGLANAKAAAEGGDAEARLEYGLLLSAAGDAAGARKELTALLDVPVARTEALRSLASMDLAEGQLQKANERFTELLTTGRYVSLGFYSLGAIYERQKDAVRAIRYYSRVTDSPYASDAQLRAARLLVNNGAREQANALLDKYMEESPYSYIELTVGRARMLANEGDAESALELVDMAQRYYPDSQELRYARSLVFERMSKPNEAIAELRTAVQRRPGDPVALNALGYTLAEHKKNLREAEQLVNEALQKTPDNPAVQDSAGWVQHRLGRNAEALKLLERAYSVEKDGEIAAHIGEVYWAMGKQTRAREIWQAALTDDPQHPYLLQTLRRYPE